MDLLAALERWCKYLRNQTILDQDDRDFIDSVDKLSSTIAGYRSRYEALSLENERMQIALINIARITNNGPYTSDRFETVNLMCREIIVGLSKRNLS